MLNIQTFLDKFYQICVHIWPVTKCTVAYMYLLKRTDGSWGKIDDINKPLTESVQYVIVCKSSNNFEAQKLSMN